MSWASRRQFKYLSIVLAFFAIIIFIFIYPLIFKKPTCTDGKQNGTETGVDCGGGCKLVCKQEAIEPVVIWSRAFHVVGNNYNLVALVENRNKDSGVVTAPYEFRVYDEENKLLGRKEGKVFIPPNKQFAVFESRFYAGDNKIKSVSFEFLPNYVWIKREPTLNTLPIRISDINFDNDKDTPTLKAFINNDSIYNIPEFDVVAILYDADGNAINASKTHKANLLSGSKIPVIFTWPEAMPAEVVTKDIFVEINPFSVSF